MSSYPNYVEYELRERVRRMEERQVRMFNMLGLLLSVNNAIGYTHKKEEYEE